MYNSSHHPSQQPASHPNSNAPAGPSNSTGNSGSSAGLPPLLLNARLHELVIAGTGQNERLEPALEHVNYNEIFYFFIKTHLFIFVLGFK